MITHPTKKPIKLSIVISFGLLSLGFSAHTLTDTLKMSENMTYSQSMSEETKPRRGITKAQVESQFGAPSSRNGPNGDPAIYYWEYSNFTVYFENNHVLHTVSKNKSNIPIN